MKIAMLLTNAYGPDFRVQKEALSLTQMGHSVTVFAWDRKGHSPKKEISSGIQVIRCRIRGSYGRGIRQALQFVLFYAWAFNCLMAYKCDAVHCHDLDTLPIGLLVGKLKSARIIYDSHEPSYFPSNSRGSKSRLSRVLARVEACLSKYVNFVIATNPWHLEKFESMGIQQALIVANYPPAGIFGDIKTKATNNSFVFGTVAAIRPMIGIELMIDAFRLLRKDVKEISLVIAGYCEQDQYLQKLKQRARLTPGVVFDTVNDLGKLQDRYERLDAVLLLYLPTERSHQLNTSTRLYESMAAKRAVIVSNVGWTAEVVKREVCGLILTEYSADALASSMLELYRNRAMARELGEKGYEAFRMRYYWELNLLSLKTVYSEANNEPLATAAVLPG